MVNGAHDYLENQKNYSENNIYFEQFLFLQMSQIDKKNVHVTERSVSTFVNKILCVRHESRFIIAHKRR